MIWYNKVKDAEKEGRTDREWEFRLVPICHPCLRWFAFDDLSVTLISLPCFFLRGIRLTMMQERVQRVSIYCQVPVLVLSGYETFQLMKDERATKSMNSMGAQMQLWFRHRSWTITWPTNSPSPSGWNMNLLQSPFMEITNISKSTSSATLTITVSRLDFLILLPVDRFCNAPLSRLVFVSSSICPPFCRCCLWSLLRLTHNCLDVFCDREKQASLRPFRA